MRKEKSAPRTEVDGKRVLVFAGKLGYQTRSFDAAARKLGVALTFITDRCHRLEDPWGDRAIAVHFESPEAAAYTVLQAARAGERVDGILALGDRPAVAAAYVGRGLGLAYNHPLAVEACRSKLRMREVFRDAGLRVPWFRVVALRPAPEPALLGISYPCVLKPVSLSASQGVVRANNREEFLAAAQQVRRVLESPEVLASQEAHLDEMIVEGYIAGKEVAVEGLLVDGVLRVLAIFDKPDPLEGPYFEETIYVTPPRLPEARRCHINRLFKIRSLQRIGFIENCQHPQHSIHQRPLHRHFFPRDVPLHNHLVQVRLLARQNFRRFQDAPHLLRSRKKFLAIVRSHHSLARRKRHRLQHARIRNPQQRRLRRRPQRNAAKPRDPQPRIAKHFAHPQFAAASLHRQRMVVSQPQTARHISRRHRWPIPQRQNPVNALARPRRRQHRVRRNLRRFEIHRDRPVAPRILQLMTSIRNKRQRKAQLSRRLIKAPRLIPQLPRKHQNPFLLHMAVVSRRTLCSVGLKATATKLSAPSASPLSPLR